MHLSIKRDMILTLVTWSFLNTCRVRVLCYANQAPLQTTNIYRCLECRWTRTLASMMVKNAGEDGEVREDRLLVWSHKDGRNLTMCSDLLIVTRVVKHHIMSLKRWHQFFPSYHYICYSPFQMPNMHFTSIMSIMHSTSIEIFKYILVFLWIYIYIHTQCF